MIHPPPFLILAPLAFAWSLALTPLVARIARAVGYLDHPDLRKTHPHPTPLLGGVAIALALPGALLLARPLGHVVPPPPVGFVVGGLLSLGLGLVDDRRPMRPLWKMIGQIAAAACLVFWGPDVDWIRANPIWLAVAIVSVVALLNAINFLDAMDGVVGTVLPIIVAGFMVLALRDGAPVDLALGWSLIGACAGFLVYNAPPARIFLGDAGSHFLGFMLAALALESLQGGPDVSHLAAVGLLLAYPLFDVLFVVVRRVKRGMPVYIGGVDHTTHALRRRVGPWGTLVALAAVVTVTVVTGVWVWAQNAQSALAAVLVFGLAYAILGLYLGRNSPTPRFDI